MWPHYEDIISRAGEPDWYWELGMPRYGQFSPEACGVYDHSVALLDIACQCCGQRFRVAVSVDMMQIVYPGATLPTSTEIGSFHYGDPPRHGCTGDTMNVDTMSVLEFWEIVPLSERIKNLNNPAFHRRPDLEFVYPEGQWPMGIAGVQGVPE
jgi:hypothetical protein